MRRSSFELLAWPAYLLAFALFVEPLSDAVLAVWPLRPALLGWRFGAIGLLSGGLMTPILALLILTVTAVALQHPRMQRLAGLLSAVTFVVLLAVTGVFTLDSVANKTVMEEGGAVSMVQYAVTVVKAIVKLVLAAAAAGGLAWAALRKSEAPKEKTERAASPSLVASARGAKSRT
jgi:hypothetical protein